MKYCQLLIIFLGTIYLNAQNSTTIYTGGGFRSQSTEPDKRIFLNDEAGFHLGLFVPFVSKSNFSFGLNLSSEYFAASKNGYDKYFSYNLYDANYTVSKDAYSKSWEKLFLGGIGPQFNFNLSDRFSISPIISFGYSYFSQNEFRIQEAVEHYDSGGNPINFTKNIFYQEKVKNSGFFWMPRIRLDYMFSDNFSLWAEGNMSFYNYKVKQTTLIPYETPPIQNGQYSWTQLVEGHYESDEENIGNHSLGINIGLAYHFGRKKKIKAKEGQPKTAEISEDCLETRISKKNNNKTYFVKKGEFPVFEWKNDDENVTDYEVKLYRTNKPFFEKDTLKAFRTNKPFFEKDSPVYVIKTKNKLIKTDKKLQKIFESISQNKTQTFAWTITTYYKDCPSQTSEPGTVKMSTNSDIGLSISSVECNGYTDDGKTKYIVKYNLTAWNDPWIVSLMNIRDTGNTNTNTNILQSINISPAKTAPATGVATQDFTVNVEVPVGINNITIEASGTQGASPASDPQAIKLPNCVCGTCDDWQISSRNESLTRINTAPASNFATLLLSGMIRVQNADPMRAVKAEIVSVQTSTADPACKSGSCTNQDSQMGLISNWSGTGLGPNNTVWTRTLTDDNNDGYANSVVWDAAANTGVSLSNYVPVRLYINLPLSSPDCCETTVYICVRYTFTDINCNTCDYLVCYDYSVETGNDNGDEPFNPDMPGAGGGK